MIPKSSLLVILLLASLGLRDASAQLNLPLQGSQNVDWFLVNYVDHDTTGLPSNYRCDWQTYHNHKGTDFVLRDFRQMDSGVSVLACQNSVVTEVLDTLFDRSKQEVTGGYGNYVIFKFIDDRSASPDSLSIVYAHLRTHSVTCHVGDTLRRGQAFALVGSSGRSSDPHLHLEVYKSQQLVDPFGDGCRGTGALPIFASSPVYDSSFLIISGGLTACLPTLDSIREHPADLTTFRSDRDSTIGMWVHGLTMKRGDSSRIDWTAPDGSLWFEYKRVNDTNIRYWYWWSYIDGPAKQPGMPTGTWTMKWFHNDDLMPSLVRTFEVSGSSYVAAGRAAQPLLSTPNPATDHLVVQGEGITEIVLADALGRQWRPRFRQQSPTSQRVDLSSVPTGAFMLHVSSPSGESMGRVVVAH